VTVTVCAQALRDLTHVAGRRPDAVVAAADHEHVTTNPLDRIRVKESALPLSVHDGSLPEESTFALGTRPTTESTTSG
jgi:hypothetical protein